MDDYVNLAEHSRLVALRQADERAEWAPDEPDPIGPVTHQGPRSWADYFAYFRRRGLRHGDAAEAAARELEDARPDPGDIRRSDP